MASISADDGPRVSTDQRQSLNRLSLGRESGSAQIFIPSSDDLKAATRLMELRGGKGRVVRQEHMHMLLELALGPDAASAKWKAIEEEWTCDKDGCLDVDDVFVGIQKGFADVAPPAQALDSPPGGEGSASAAAEGSGIGSSRKFPAKSPSKVLPAAMMGSFASTHSPEGPTGRKLPGKAPGHLPPKGGNHGITKAASKALVRSKGNYGTSFHSLTEYVSAFLRFDQDGDKVIGALDLKKSVECATECTPTLEECEAAIQEADIKGKGFVTLLEFRELTHHLDELWTQGAGLGDAVHALRL